MTVPYMQPRRRLHRGGGKMFDMTGAIPMEQLPVAQPTEPQLPIMQPTDQTARIASAPAAPQPERLGFLDRLLGLQSRNPDARNAGLMNMGLSLLGGQPTSAAAAVGAGREGAQAHIAQERNREMLGTLAGFTGEGDQLPGIFAAMMRGGNIEGARAISGMMREQNEFSPYEFVETDGQVQVFDKRTGQQVQGAAAAAASATAGLPPRQRELAWQMINSNAGRTAPLEVAAVQFNQMDATIQRLLSTQGEMGPDALALIYNYAKLLDPGSVVREGELDIQNRAGSLWMRMQNAISGLQRGGPTRRYLEAMREAARGLNAVYADAYDRSTGRLRRQFSGLTGLPGERLPVGDSPFTRTSRAVPAPRPRGPNDIPTFRIPGRNED